MTAQPMASTSVRQIDRSILDGDPWIAGSTKPTVTIKRTGSCEDICIAAAAATAPDIVIIW